MKHSSVTFIGMAALSAALFFVGCPTGIEETSPFSTPAEYREMLRIEGTGADKTLVITGAGTDGVFVAGRTVTLSPYEIAKYETTYQLWNDVFEWAILDVRGEGQYVFAFPGYEGHQPVDTSGQNRTGTSIEKFWTPEQKRTRAVTYISWRDAMIWCNAYSELCGLTPVYYQDEAYTRVQRKATDTGGANTDADKVYVKRDAEGYRLPTEAEWEAAARGGSPSDDPESAWNTNYAGGKKVESIAWFRANAGPDLSGNATGSDEEQDTVLATNHRNYGVHPVGTLPANGAGLFDMSGNAYEWCYDWYAASVGTGDAPDPAGPLSGSARVMRGGSWRHAALSCRVDTRASYPPDDGGDYIGFRVARSVH
ncbi:MAG: formylglycine-generating enzyme family protein [Treponema sp.]|jgi:formylglycine-generating enzyme required for sulfatase activity|nr:formylglycine-generating enzyme family protein [Treponema sp.]